MSQGTPAFAIPQGSKPLVFNGTAVTSPIYTVPAGKRAVILSVSLTTISAGVTGIAVISTSSVGNLLVANIAATAGDRRFLSTEVVSPVDAAGTIDFTVAGAAGASLYFAVSGYEYSPSETGSFAPKLPATAKAVAVSKSATAVAGYTVPANRCLVILSLWGNTKGGTLAIAPDILRAGSTTITLLEIDCASPAGDLAVSFPCVIECGHPTTTVNVGFFISAPAMGGFTGYEVPLSAA